MGQGKIPKKTLGKRITVVFYDHFIGDNELEKSIHRIEGNVAEINDQWVKFHWWTCLDEGSDGSDNEVAKLMQGTFLRWGYSEPKKWFNVE